MESGNLLKDRRLYLIFSITMIAVMGVASLTPAFPKISESLGLSKAQVGLLISGFTLPGIFLAPIAGILADRFGRKTVLVPSLFVFAIAGFACYFTSNFHTLLILRIIQGVGGASLGSLNVTLIGDFFKGKERPTAMGYNATVLSLMTASYPLIGGLMAAAAWNNPFLLTLLAVPIAFFVWFGMKEPEYEKSKNFNQYFNALLKSLVKKEVIGIFSLSIVTFIILYGAILTYLPFLLKERFNFNPGKIGILISVSSLSTALVASFVGKLTDKFGSKNLLFAAFALYALSALMIPFIKSVYLLILPIIFFGTGQALNIPSLQTLLANFAPDSQRAIFMSTNGMVLRLGQTLGPMVITLGYVWGEITGVYVLAAVLAVIGILIISFAIKKRK